MEKLTREDVWALVRGAGLIAAGVLVGKLALMFLWACARAGFPM